MTLDETKPFFRKDGKLKGKLLNKSNFTLEEVYNCIHDTQTPLCVCNNKLKISRYNKGYQTFCSVKCQTKSTTEKVKQTKLEKYGSIGYNNRDKAKQTSLEKYGIDVPSKSAEAKNKAKQTSLEKYGVEAYPMTDKYKNKVKQTSLEKYGVEHYTQSDVVKDKVITNNLKKYGRAYPIQQHLKHYDDYNKKYIEEHFIIDGRIDRVGIMNYYNKSTTMSAIIQNFGLTVDNNSVENDINILFDSVFTMNTRKIIVPYELDMYSKEHNFAVEYNGLYWHSDKFKDKNYHLMKTELCEEKGIQLFHIFENEWLDASKKDIWISMIKGKQGLHTRLGARKCTIKEVGSKEAREFLDENHMQGSVNGSIRIALIYDNKIVSLMTFGKARMSKKYEYELLRFCTKKNLTVQGAGSRLLKFFEENYKPKSLVSYANRRWSEGNLYEKLDFTFIHNSAPNYYYFLNNKALYSRNMFQKHKLKDRLENFDAELSEKDNMKLHKYRSIYDSGNKVYIKIYK